MVDYSLHVRGVQVSDGGVQVSGPRGERTSRLAEPRDDTLRLVLWSETQQILGGDL